jgi:hypothetical protein
MAAAGYARMTELPVRCLIKRYNRADAHRPRPAEVQEIQTPKDLRLGHLQFPEDDRSGVARKPPRGNRTE